MKTLIRISLYKWILSVLVSCCISSCGDRFLEITPKGKLIATDVEDYDLLLNNNTLLNTGGANAQLYLGDDVAAVDPYFIAAERRIQRLFNAEAHVYESDENAPETQSLLSQLYIYNKVIKEVPTVEGGSPAQKKAIEAEARAGRAWVYFQLINYFGKPYDDASAATDLGFPIITEADVTATSFERATVAETYNFIVEDLLLAIPDLPAETTFRIRMSRAAGEALLAKVYVFMRKYEQAKPLFDQALGSMLGTPSRVELTDYNAAFADGGLFMPDHPSFGPLLPTIAEDTETVYARQFSNFSVTTSELVIPKWVVSLFEPADLRLRFFSKTPFPTGDPYPDGLLRRMAPLTVSYGVLLPDVLLLRAECRARTGDLAGSVDDIVLLRSHRMPEADVAIPETVAIDRQMLVSYVFEERLREFAGRGERWFDMRRLSVDPEFGVATFRRQRYAQDGSITDIPLPAERLQLKIPPKILAENPDMRDNP